MKADHEVKRALVVDDERMARLIHRAHLLKAGCRVEEAEDASVAIQKFSYSNDYFDIVLLDYNMPAENGAAVAQKIRQIEAERGSYPVLIIGITAHNDPAIKNQCHQAGMNVILSKPVLFSDIKKLCEEYWFCS